MILRRFEVVFWCLEWECCTFSTIDGNAFKSTNTIYYGFKSERFWILKLPQSSSNARSHPHKNFTAIWSTWKYVRLPLKYKQNSNADSSIFPKDVMKSTIPAVICYSLYNMWKTSGPQMGKFIAIESIVKAAIHHENRMTHSQHATVTTEKCIFMILVKHSDPREGWLYSVSKKRRRKPRFNPKSPKIKRNMMKFSSVDAIIFIFLSYGTLD